VAVLGDGACGKSSLINNFRSDGFVAVYKQTVGCEFYEKKISIRDQLISLRLWDIGGQSIHSKNIQQYVSTSSAVFLVYDVTNTESFNNLDDWLRALAKYGVTKNVYLVGNKVDMISQRQVTLAQHNAFMKEKENNFRGSLFMSAKSGENVVKAFYQVAGEVLQMPLTEGELDVYTKVLKVSLPDGVSQDGGRTAFADQIEAEDRAAAEAAKKGQEACLCVLC